MRWEQFRESTNIENIGPFDWIDPSEGWCSISFPLFPTPIHDYPITSPLIPVLVLALIFRKVIQYGRKRYHN